MGVHGPSMVDLAGSTSPGDERVSTKTKMVLALGSASLGIQLYVGGFYLNNFFLEVACLGPAHVALIHAVQCSFDAFNDPLLGYLSDRTQTRFGRRRAWLLVAGPFMAASYACLYQTLPADTSESLKVAYHMVTYMAMGVAMTFVDVQLNALVPEITHDYDERTVLCAYRAIGMNTIGALSVVAQSQVIALVKPLAFSYSVSAIVLGLLMWSLIWIAFVWLKERPQSVQTSRMSFLAGIRMVSMNRSFVCVCLTYIAGLMAVGMVQTNLMMYSKYVLRSEGLMTTLLPFILLTGQLSIPFWVKLSQHWNKRHVVMFGYTLLLIVEVILPFIPPEATPLIILAGIVIGFTMSVPCLLPPSMLPDVIEDDELRSGERREGAFAGCFTMPLKLAGALSLTCTNTMLKVAGYQAPQSTCGAANGPSDMPDIQSDAVVGALRLLIGPIPAVFLALGIVAAYFFPITRESHKALVARVAQAKEAHADVMPLDSSTKGSAYATCTDNVPQGRVGDQMEMPHSDGEISQQHLRCEGLHVPEYLT